MSAELCDLMLWPASLSSDELAELNTLTGLIQRHVERISEILAGADAAPTTPG